MFTTPIRSNSIGCSVTNFTSVFCSVLSSAVSSVKVGYSSVIYKENDN